MLQGSDGSEVERGRASETTAAALPTMAVRLDDPDERRVRLRQLSASLAPVTLSADRGFPVVGPLRQLFVDEVLPRGVTVSVEGGDGLHSLAVALAVEAVKAGSRLIALGFDSLNWEVAAGFGVPVDRVVLVRLTDRSPVAEAVAAGLDAADFVLCDAERVNLPPASVRRLRARARERGSVLVRIRPQRERRRSAVSGWDDAEVTVNGRTHRWIGPGAGWGHLEGRLLRVDLGGRRAAFGGRSAVIWLPDADGVIREPDEEERRRHGVVVDGRGAGPGAVIPLRRTGTTG